MKIIHTEDVIQLRKRAYPSLTVLADALYHQSQGNPALLDDYLAAVDAVKKMYPKEPVALMSPGMEPP